MANPLVQTVWRRLPVGFRRGLAHGVLDAFAPQLPPYVQPPPAAPYIVVGFLSSPSGLGQAARLATKALMGQGHDVYGVDLSRHFFEMSDRVLFDVRDGREVLGPGRVLVNINAPYLKYAFHLLGRSFLRDKEITAYWAWELPQAPMTWREGFRRAHRIAVPSEFVRSAVRSLGEGPPVIVAPHPVALERLPVLTPRLQPISPSSPFTVVSSFNVASGFERKNPLALVAAFRAAFAGRRDVRLRLHATGAEHYPSAARRLHEMTANDPVIELTTEAFDRDKYWAWYGTPDLFASLHRAEGFGLGIAEAMCMGVPTLATNWSANAEYMNENNSIPIAYQLVPVVDPQRKYESGVWAEPDVRHAAAMLVLAATDSDWLAALAEQARRDATARFSGFAVQGVPLSRS